MRDRVKRRNVGACEGMRDASVARAMQGDVRARIARVRECVRGCVQRAREMCTTTIQILLLLLREQSAVNRLPRHNVSIQVRSGVLNRSAPLREKASRKNRANPNPSSSNGRYNTTEQVSQILEFPWSDIASRSRQQFCQGVGYTRISRVSREWRERDQRGGESRRIVARSKIAIITFDPIPINSLAKGKTRPINGTNGSVNGETMVEY